MIRKKPEVPEEVGFILSKSQQVKLSKFFDEVHDDTNTGAIGGRYTYSITPTGLGVVLRVTDSVSQKSVDLTDYDTW